MKDVVLEVKDLKKFYSISSKGISFKKLVEKNFVHAVDGVSFSIRKGEILALVGESGSGKTTTGMCSLALNPPTSGEVLLEGENLVELFKSHRWREMCLKVQMIFQDPYSSLNPRHKVYKIVEEPIVVHKLAKTKEEKYKKICNALEDAGLKPAEDYLDRYPEQLSGGQRQRVAIACALVMSPLYLVADEPSSMLDVSIRAEILNLLLKLRDEHNLAMLYITHDLASAAYLANRVAVMYLGRVVEEGPAESIFANPQHPYTKALMSVVPTPGTKSKRERIVLKGETPNPINLPKGCRFQPRCPVAIPQCKEIDPQLEQVMDGHKVACILNNM